jgi:hypothetical protein
MVMQYLYFLDYPQPGLESADLDDDDDHKVNGEKANSNGEHLVNGVHPTDDERSRTAVNGDAGQSVRDSSVPTGTDSRTAEPPESVSLDEIYPIPPKPKNKKKKKNKKKAEDGDTPTEGANGEPPPPQEEDVTAPLADLKITEDNEPQSATAEEAAESPVSNAGFLAVHAKVYELSKKYVFSDPFLVALQIVEPQDTNSLSVE